MSVEESLVPQGIFVRPCVNGSSTTGAFFNFSLISECTNPDNCSRLIENHEGASSAAPILLSLAGITGQIGALTYLHWNQRGLNRKTVFYVMLTTLIWTDLIGKLITTPEAVISYAIGYWNGGEPICNLHGYSMSLIGIVTHLLVAIMALERLVGVRHGFFYQRFVTITRTRILLSGTWLFCLLFCLGPFLHIGEFKLHFPGTWCHLSQHVCADAALATRIFHNLYSTINLVCLVVMVSCNLIVVGTLMKMRVTHIKPSNQPGHQATGLKEREVQMVILLLIITIAFISSWAPHDLLMFKNQLYPPPPYVDPTLDIKVIRLVSFNQIIDPWAYIISRLIFRSKLWKCCRNKTFGKMIAHSESGRYDRKGSILSAFSMGSRKNSRASPTMKAGQEEFSLEEDAEREAHRLADEPDGFPRKKHSQVHFQFKEESTSKGAAELSNFLRPEPLKHRLRKAIPRAFASFLTRSFSNKSKDKGGSPSLPPESAKVYSICYTPPLKDYEQMSLLDSASGSNPKSTLEQCMSPYLMREGKHRMDDKGLDVALMSLHGRSNSWCGPTKSDLGSLYRSHSMEAIRNQI